MGKKKSKLVIRPWCWYCEREFEDEKVLMQHQKAKHFKCNMCPRRLNTAGGLAVHIQQVHKLEPENLPRIENALPGRDGYEVEIFGMVGIPAPDVADYKRRKEIELGLTAGSISQPQQKRPKIENRPLSEEELKAQLEAHKALMGVSQSSEAAPAPAPADSSSSGAVYGAPPQAYVAPPAPAMPPPGTIPAPGMPPPPGFFPGPPPPGAFPGAVPGQPPPPFPPSFVPGFSPGPPPAPGFTPAPGFPPAVPPPFSPAGAPVPGVPPIPGPGHSPFPPPPPPTFVPAASPSAGFGAVSPPQPTSSVATTPASQPLAADSRQQSMTPSSAPAAAPPFLQPSQPRADAPTPTRPGRPTLPNPALAQTNPPFKKATVLKYPDPNFSPEEQRAYNSRYYYDATKMDSQKQAPVEESRGKKRARAEDFL